MSNVTMKALPALLDNYKPKEGLLGMTPQYPAQAAPSMPDYGNFMKAFSMPKASPLPAAPSASLPPPPAETAPVAGKPSGPLFPSMPTSGGTAPQWLSDYLNPSPGQKASAGNAAGGGSIPASTLLPNEGMLNANGGLASSPSPAVDTSNPMQAASQMAKWYDTGNQSGAYGPAAPPGYGSIGSGNLPGLNNGGDTGKGPTVNPGTPDGMGGTFGNPGSFVPRHAGDDGVGSKWHGADNGMTQPAFPGGGPLPNGSVVGTGPAIYPGAGGMSGGTFGGDTGSSGVSAGGATGGGSSESVPRTPTTSRGIPGGLTPGGGGAAVMPPGTQRMDLTGMSDEEAIRAVNGGGKSSALPPAPSSGTTTGAGDYLPYVPYGTGSNVPAFQFPSYGPATSSSSTPAPSTGTTATGSSEPQSQGAPFGNKSEVQAPVDTRAQMLQATNQFRNDLKGVLGQTGGQTGGQTAPTSATQTAPTSLQDAIQKAGDVGKLREGETEDQRNARVAEYFGADGYGDGGSLIYRTPEEIAQGQKTLAEQQAQGLATNDVYPTNTFENSPYMQSLKTNTPSATPSASGAVSPQIQQTLQNLFGNYQENMQQAVQQAANQDPYGPGSTAAQQQYLQNWTANNGGQMPTGNALPAAPTTTLPALPFGASQQQASGSGSTTGTTSPAATGNTNVDQLASTYQQQTDAAKAANEARYNQLVDGYLGRLQGAQTELGNLSTQDAQDVTKAFGQARAKTDSDLTNRGLGNTTVRSTAMQGLTREETAAQRRLADERSRERLNTNASLQGDLLKFMEGRNDTGPDINQLIALAQLLGQGGGLVAG